MNPVSKLPSVTAFGMHLVDLRRVARERGRVRMVLASMWHGMVPKAPLGCLLIAGQPHSCHTSLNLVNLRCAARERGRVRMGTRPNVACDGVQGAPRVLAHGWVPYERFSCMYTAPQLPYSHLVNLVIDQMGPKTRFWEKMKAYGAKVGKPRGV